MKKNIGIIVIMSIGILVAIGIFSSGRGTPVAEALSGFAKCLTAKGFKMYGAYWCLHCQNEKAAFGKAFNYVNYVECTEKPEVCTSAGIKGFPTWITKDGRRFEGEMGIERLAEASSCSVSTVESKK